MHSPTLIMMMSILSAVMALTQIAVWYFNRQIPGLAAWAVAYCSAFISSLNFLFRTNDNELFWVLSWQFSQFFVAYLMYHGIRDYLGQRPARAVHVLAALVLLLGATTYFTLWERDPVQRIVVSSLISGGLFILSAVALANRHVLQFPARNLLAIPCGLHGLFLIYRIFMIEMTPNQSLAAFDRNSVPAAFVIETIVFLIIMAFGTLILANEYITRELRKLAEQDALTGTCNRRTFLTLLSKNLSIARRRNSPLSVVIIDLDHFKKINDTWGHKQGDIALGHFVNIAMSCLRKEDVLGRLGGEEFGICLPDTGLAGARIVAERLRAEIAAVPVISGNSEIRLTISAGVVECANDETPDDILHRADSAMYMAKQNGRNRVELDIFISGLA